jgi:hypothetical protein
VNRSYQLDNFMHGVTASVLMRKGIAGTRKHLIVHVDNRQSDSTEQKRGIGG